MLNSNDLVKHDQPVPAAIFPRNPPDTTTTYLLHKLDEVATRWRRHETLTRTERVLFTSETVVRRSLLDARRLRVVHVVNWRHFRCKKKEKTRDVIVV